MLPAAVAAVIGAMMFYGRISDVYMGVITLVVTLILFKFMNATAGDAYRIGAARLGGFNGIPAFPILNVPGDPSIQIFGTPFYYVVAVLLLLCYLLCRWILALDLRPCADRHPRERGARRAARLQRAAVQDGDLHDQRGNGRRSPAACSPTGPRSSRRACSALGQSAEVIIWTIVGGLGTLVGPMLGAIVLGMLKLLLGQQTLIDNSLVLGAILVLVVLLLPRGLLPTLRALARAPRPWPASAAARPAARVADARLAVTRDAADDTAAGTVAVTDTVLDTRDLSMRFGGVQAVNNVNFSLKERELRCLIGPNGAGKSTFFKCLTGQIRLDHTHGRVFIRGQDVTGWRAYEIVRLGVGIKTQVPSVMNGLSVEENLWLSARRVSGREAARAVVAEVIEQMSLEGIARRTVGELAHGQRQLVEIGLVLAQRPWLLLLDEPAAGITGAEAEQLVRIIHAGQPEGHHRRGRPRHGVRAHARRAASRCCTRARSCAKGRSTTCWPTRWCARSTSGAARNESVRRRTHRRIERCGRRRRRARPTSCSTSPACAPATATCRCCTASTSSCARARRSASSATTAWARPPS